MTFLLGTFSIFSQNLSQSIISSQGSFDSTTELSLEWTLGEIFVETITEGSSIFTQGFHQSSIDQISVEEEQNPQLSFNIKVYPNPVKSLLNLTINGDYTAPIHISLFDISGRYIKAFPLINNVTNKSYSVDDLSSGIYILKIKSTDGAYSKTSKIIKF